MSRDRRRSLVRRGVEGHIYEAAGNEAIDEGRRGRNALAEGDIEVLCLGRKGQDDVEWKRKE